MSTHRARAILAALIEFSTRSRQRRQKLLVSICLVSLLAAGLFSLNAISSVAAWGTKAKPQGSGSGVTVGRSGEPFIKLLGTDLPASFTGSADAQAVVNGNDVNPLSMASGDINKDGTDDIVYGLSNSRGSVLAFMFGNVDSIYPNSPDAQRRKAQGAFTDAPFQRSGKAISCPTKPDFIATGNFTNSGFMDLVVASFKSDKLFLLAGDDKGFEDSDWSTIVLPGSVTALAAGEANRRDGLTDVVVGISGSGGNQVLVFQDPRGALIGPWESFRIGGEATSIAFNQMDLDSASDLVVANSASKLTIIHGRDRKQDLDESLRRNVPAAVIEERSFPFAITSVVTGKFTENSSPIEQCNNIAMLATDGSIHVIYQDPAAPGSGAGFQGWTEKRLGAGAWPGATKLVAGHLSSLSRESVLVVDRAHALVEILTDATVDGRAQGNLPEVVSATLNVDGGPGSVLPMRMTSSSLKGLVVLRNGHSAPSVVLPTAVMTFTVTNTLDSGAGSLRQALIDSNTNPGADTISFAIGSGPQTISPTADLPPVNDPVTIDATTQPGFAGAPLITLSGALTGSGIGFKIGAGTTTVRGLVINNCTLSAVQFILNGSDHLEGCYIGTDSAGTGAAPNLDGVKVFSVSSNVVGGTVAAARNVISGNNDSGVDVAGVTMLGNTVQGNYIGTNAAGSGAVPNLHEGVYLNAKLTTVGGLTPGERNVISGNGNNGVLILNDTSITGTLVQGNYIGINAGGVAAVPNALSGVRILNAPSHTIGGTAIGALNVISGNTGDGVFISDLTSTGNVIQGNTIGSVGLGNGGKGIRVNLSSFNTIGGISPTAPNTISGNGDDGIAITSATVNHIRRNSIFSNTGLGIDLGDDGVTPNDFADPDSGANDLQNFPMLAQVIGGPSTTILGQLNSTPNSSFIVEFFLNTACDGTGNGEGQSFIGDTVVSTDASGNASFFMTIPVASSTGQFVTANSTINSGSPSTSEFGPCALVCTFALAPPSQSFGSAGGTGSFTVTTGGSCTWTAVSSAGFVTITSGASGSGSGTVNFSVAPNTTVNPRSATITVINQVFTINQAGCTFAIAPPNQSFTPAGGTGSIAVTTGCAWTAVSNAAFVTITSGASGTGNGTVNFSVAANTSTTPRSATITVVDQVFTVNQGGCTYAIAPPNQSFTEAGGTGSITVTSPGVCPWTAVSSAGFVTVTSGASGAGNGTVNFSVAVNVTTSPRSATITVVDQVFTVNQAAAPCMFSILPTSQSFTATGGTSSVAVTAQPGCAWTAVSNDGFITVTSGAAGSGNGTVNYSVAAKGDIGARMGTITIAGNIFTVTQSGVDCLTFTIMPTSMSFPIAGGTGSVSVTTGGGCPWSAASNAAFITITSGSSGTGNGTVNYSVAPNGPTSSPRSGTMTIAGQTFTVNQDGACPLSISPSGRTFSAPGGTGDITVTTDPTCTWTAVKDVVWITITSGSSGTGNGTVRYSVAPNPTGVQRQGTVTVSGKVHTVKQN